MMSPFVSVIVTTYNRQSLLIETIQSILNQTYLNFEVIVVDNYSDYDFYKVLNSFNDNKIRGFQNHNNGLYVINKNYAIQQARGQYIAFCDDDDLWLPNKLEICSRYFDKYDFITTNFFVMNGSGIKNTKLTDLSKLLFYSVIFYDLVYKGNFIPSCGTIVKTDIIKNIPFSESKEEFLFEDYFAWLRILKNKNYKAKYIRKKLSIYRISQFNTSLTNNYLNAIMNMKKLLPSIVDDNVNRTHINFLIGKHLYKLGYKTRSCKFLIKTVLYAKSYYTKFRAAVLLVRVYILD